VTKDTVLLSVKVKCRFVNKLLKNNVLIFNENELPVVTKAFLQAFNSMEEFDLTEMIKKITNDDEFLTKMIKLGGCLIVFNVPRNELFHSLNIVAYMVEFPNCRKQDCENILKWLDLSFPKNLLEKAQLIKSKNILEKLTN